MGWLGAQLIAQDICMVDFFSEPSGGSLESVVSPQFALLPAGINGQTGCCATFPVVVNDFSGKVLFIKCWFLSVTATMTPDSWQLLLAKIAYGTRDEGHHLSPYLSSTSISSKGMYCSISDDSLRKTFCALVLGLRLSSSSSFYPFAKAHHGLTHPLRPSCCTSGVCAFVIVRTSRAISVRAPLSKQWIVISLPRQLFDGIIQPPLILRLPSRVMGTCCLGTLSIFQCCFRSRDLLPRLSSSQRGAPRCLGVTFGLLVAAVSQQRSTVRTERRWSRKTGGQRL